MKIINIILSIILLILSCMPCADMKVNSIVVHSAPEVVATQQNHSHNKENDLCPPFCVCNCCSAQVLTSFSVTIINFPIVIPSIKLPLPTYKSILTSNFYGSIWQPPQINA